MNIAPVGTFDPTVNYAFSWDRTSSPLNSLVVAGVPSVTTYSASYSGSYTQLLPTGTSYFVSLNGLRSSSHSKACLLNPDVATRLSVGFNQPLLSGFGPKSNLRFELVARNNENVSGAIFRTQLQATMLQVENAYWDFAEFQDNVKVAEESLATAQRLYDNSKRQEAVGTLAPLDVVSAQSAVAGSERDLVVARTNFQIQEIAMKNLLSKRTDPELEAAEIVTTDPLPAPRDSDIPQLQDVLTEAFRARPDLQVAQMNLLNEQISTQYTSNNLLPTGNVFGQYAAAGCKAIARITTKGRATGHLHPILAPGTVIHSGASASLLQMAQATFPEESVGFSLTLPIKNRAAQADNIRAQFEMQQAQISLQSLQNRAELVFGKRWSDWYKEKLRSKRHMRPWCWHSSRWTPSKRSWRWERPPSTTLSCNNAMSRPHSTRKSRLRMATPNRWCPWTKLAGRCWSATE